MGRKRPSDIAIAEEIEGVVARDLAAFGVRLREARLKAGLTQHQLGYKANASQAYIFELESGTQNLTFGSMAKLAHACGVAIRDLLPETNAEPPTTASMEMLCSLLKQVRDGLAEFRTQEVRRQAVQGTLIQKLRAFADMGESLEHFLHPAEVPPSTPDHPPARVRSKPAARKTGV